jgi:hypothetical protein
MGRDPDEDTMVAAAEQLRLGYQRDAPAVAAVADSGDVQQTLAVRHSARQALIQ